MIVTQSIRTKAKTCFFSIRDLLLTNHDLLTRNVDGGIDIFDCFHGGIELMVITQPR